MLWGTENASKFDFKKTTTKLDSSLTWHELKKPRNHINNRKENKKKKIRKIKKKT